LSLRTNHLWRLKTVSDFGLFLLIIIIIIFTSDNDNGVDLLDALIEHYEVECDGT